MVVQVDFYVLQSSDVGSRLKTVCRITDKIQRMGHKILVLTEDSKQSKKLDDMMWTFSQSSFLPHAMLSEVNGYQDQTPVLIHHELIETRPDVLINLKDKAVQIKDIQRLVEIVDQDENVKNKGRHKYREYKTQALSVKTHHLPG